MWNSFWWRTIRALPVVYSGTEAPPDTFKDNSQALAEGSFGRDGVFHAKQLQAKCASKYAPQQPGDPATGNIRTPSRAKSMTANSTKAAISAWDPVTTRSRACSDGTSSDL